MDQEHEQECHEHDFEVIENPAANFARALCWLGLAVAIGAIAFYLQAPSSTRALIDAYATWPCIIACTIGAIAVIIANLS